MQQRIRRFAAIVTIACLPVLPAQAATVRIKGGGWGHGIGMSQYGAYGRAKRGDSYGAILRHYYSGVTLRETAIRSPLRVGLLQARGSVGVSSSAFQDGGGQVTFEVQGSSKVIASGGPKIEWRVEPSTTGGLRLFRNGERVQHEGRSVFGAPGKPLIAIYEKHGSLLRVAEKNNSYAYGRMYFGTYEGGCSGGYCLRLVLSLPMQKYLYGLGEVPSSWPGAALRAQAIAGRTYAYDKVVRYTTLRYPCGCHVYDSVIDQAYIGDAKRTGSGQYWDDWKAAVDDTKDEVLFYDGAPIQALYSSSSGGHTEHNENVWGGSPIAYLRGVPDGPDDNPANPNHNWSLSMSLRAFKDKLEAAYNDDPDTRFGRFERFELVKPFGISGRVTVVKPGTGGGARIRGTDGVARVSGWSLRSVLALKDTLFRVRIEYPVAARFEERYASLDGAPGDPAGAAYAVPRGASEVFGQAQDFSSGRMTWTKQTDTVVWQHGPVLAHYDALGRERSALGMPVTGVWGPGAFLGAGYVNGMIVWTSGTGARSVRGAVADLYRSLQAARGPLGAPAGELRSGTSTGKWKRQRFATGTIYKKPKGEAFALWGAIEARYRAIGEAGSPCGLPAASMDPSAEQLRATFQNGSIEVVDGKVVVDCG